jgi:ParB/RepB/Spo0J family partition protein
MTTQNIPLDRLYESPTNPRKTFRNLDDLAQSLKSVGMLQPILARAHGTNGSTRFEIIFGHRRFRAAKLAELAEVPVDVRVMNDKEVLETQLIENVQRDDVDALEEADGYKRLLDEHGYTVDDLAVKLAKSKATIYARLKLCELGVEGRAALAAGKLTPSTALLVARVPATLQGDAVKELDPDEYRHRETEGDEDRSDPLGAREALRRIQGRFMLRLADAPFDCADAALVPAAGACTTCPKRTGNQPELFSDVKSADTCIDPACFASKRDAGWEAQKAAALGAGRKVLDSTKLAKELFPYGGRLAHNSGFVDLDEKDFSDGKGTKTFRDRYGKKLGAVAVTLARDQEGKVHELVDMQLVKKLQPAADRGDALDPGPAKGAKDSKAEQDARAQAAAERAAAVVLMGAVVTKVAKKDLDRASWLAVIEELLLMSATERVLERRGLLAAAQDDMVKATKAFEASVQKMPVGDLRALVIELLFTQPTMDLEGGPFGRLCKALKVDTKQAVANERARLKTEPKGKATPKKK